MFVKLQSQLRFAPSSNFDASNYDEVGKHLAVLSVNLSRKASYTAVNSRRARHAQARRDTTCYP